MDNEFLIGLTGGLDEPSSKEKLDSDIDSISKKLDKLKLKGEIEKTEIGNIEKQLNDLKAVITNVSVDPKAISDIVDQINNSLKGIQINNITFNPTGLKQQGQHIGKQVGGQVASGINDAIQKGNFEKSFKFDVGNRNSVAKEAEEYFEKLTGSIVTVKENMVDFDGSTQLRNFSVNIRNVRGEVEQLHYAFRAIEDDKGNVIGQHFVYTGGSINDKDVIRQYEAIENAHAKYSAKFAEFKSTNGQILSGLSNEVKDFENKLAGLKNGSFTINDVTQSFNSLKTAASNISSGLSSQFNKVDTAIRNIEKGDETIANLKASFSGLNNAPKDINKELTKCASLLTNVRDIESKQGRTQDWAKAYREWEKAVDSLRAKLKVLQKEQSNSVSSEIYNIDDLKNANIAYMSKKRNSIDVQMVEIQKMAKAKGWVDFDVKGFEEADGKINSLKITVTEATGAVKELNFETRKLQGRGKAQNGLMQIGDVKIIKTATKASEELAKMSKKMQSDFKSLKHDIDSANVPLDTISGDIEKINKVIGKVEIGEILNKTEIEKTLALITSVRQELNRLKTDKNNAASSDKVRINAQGIKESLELFEKEHSGFSTWTKEINGSIVSIESLKKELNNVNDSTDFTVLQAKIKAFKDSFISTEKEAKQLYNGTIEALNNLNSLEEKQATKNPSTDEWKEYEVRIDSAKDKLNGLLESLWNFWNGNQEFFNIGELEKFAEIMNASENRLNLIKARISDQKNVADENEKLKESKRLYNEVLDSLRNLNSLREKQAKVNLDTDEWKEYENQIESTTKEYQELLDLLFNSPSSNYVTIDQLSRLDDEASKSENALRLLHARISDLNTKKIKDIKFNLDNGDGINNYRLRIDTLVGSFEKYGVAADEIKNKTANLESILAGMVNPNVTGSELLELASKFEQEFKSVKISVDSAKNSFDKFVQPVSSDKITSLIIKIQNFLSKNTAITKEAKVELERYLTILKSGGEVSLKEWNDINLAIKKTESEMRSIGRLGKSFKDQLKQAAESFSQWISVSSAIMFAVQKTKEAVTELKEVNTLLVEISKANDKLTKTDLVNIGDNAFDVASKYGKKATDYLSGVQEASRAGYQNAEAIAELSTATQGAGDMTAELANQMIIATDKAYKLGGSTSELTKILDGMNYITNHNAVNMTELSEGMSIVGSTAASFGVEANELTAALATMSATTQQSGSEVARAFRAILLNIRQVSDEEENIDAEGLTKYEQACNALGVTLKETVNGVQQLRDPMEVLKELSIEYNKLSETDVKRTNLLNSVGGKLRSTQLDALLRQWSSYEKMLQQFEDGSGSMAVEAEKTANSWEGSLNRISNTWKDTVENVINSDAVITAINALNEFLQILNKATEKLGSLGTIGVGAGLFMGIKEVGVVKL